MVLDKLSSAGASYNLDTVGQGPTTLAEVRVGAVWTFYSHLSFLSLSLFTLFTSKSWNYVYLICVLSDFISCLLGKVKYCSLFLSLWGGGRVVRWSWVNFLWGWSGGALVLGKLPVPGRPTILITVGQGPIALAVGAGGGGLDIFTLLYLFSSLSPSLLGDGPI